MIYYAFQRLTVIYFLQPPLFDRKYSSIQVLINRAQFTSGENIQKNASLLWNRKENVSAEQQENVSLDFLECFVCHSKTIFLESFFAIFFEDSFIRFCDLIRFFFKFQTKVRILVTSKKRNFTSPFKKQNLKLLVIFFFNSLVTDQQKI